MPSPLSVTRILRRPPSSISTAMRVAPASREFSMSSLTIEAGRSTTSPAAMRFAISAGRTRIFGTSGTSGLPNLDSQFSQLLFGNRGRRSAHHIHGACGFRKCNDIAYRTHAGEDHDHAIQSQCDATMRGRSKLECLQEESKLVARFRFGKTQRLEDPRLYGTAVNSNRTAADF